MAYTPHSLAALSTLTSNDVADALTAIRKDGKSHPIGQEGRAGVYSFTKENISLAFKFTSEKAAQAHVMNTELFQFFKIPIVPCRAFSLDKNFDSKQFFIETNHAPDTQEEMTHIVVMPFTEGKNLKTVLDKKNPDDETSIKRLNENVLRYATSICLAYHWDCLPKNIIVDTTEEGINPDSFTFVDAEHALLTEEKLNIQNLPLATLEYKYMTEGERKCTLHKKCFYENMLTESIYWQKQIENNLSITSYQKSDDLKQALRYRNRFLQAHLTNE